MSSNFWEISKAEDIPLDKSDVIEGLAKKLHNVEFTNEIFDPVYPVDVERTNIDELVVSMSDGTEFVIKCEEK